MLSENDNRAARELGIDLGRGRLFLKAKPGAKLEAVTSAWGAREGQRVTKALERLRRAKPHPEHQPHVFDADGEPIGGIIVQLDDGYLTSLEIYWYENPISPFPPLHRVILLGEGEELH